MTSTKYDIAKLNSLYSDGESADQSLFAEMRSNVLLYAGDMFKNVNEKLISRLKDSTLSQEQKLKLSINHIQCIVKLYVNNLISESPNVQFLPQNDKEHGDRKDAQLAQAVWANACDKQNFREKRDQFAHSFVTMGEIVGFIYYDQTKGHFKGMRQAVNEAGEPLFEHPVFGQTTESVDENGQPLQMAASDEGVFSGELCIEVINPTCLKRPANCENLDEAEWLCIEKMVPLDVAKSLIGGLAPEEREEKLKFITENGKSTFTVMDGGRGEYRDTKGQCQLRYFYFRPSPSMPKGKYMITCGTNGILLSDELPFGQFPIVTENFDEVSGSPRGRSIIKPLRPVQVEINRLASGQALNSILFGDTKVFLPTGSKMTKGQRYDGVREYQVSGGMPQFSEGKPAMEQFAAAIKDKVAEMYQLANIEFETADGQSTDPTSIIYKAKSQKKRYMLYVQKFEGFMVKLAKLYIALAKQYLSDEDLIRAVGKRESINIAEFRQIDEKNCRIKAVPKTGDADDLFMQHLSLQAALQYAGKDLPKHVIGKIVKSMPFISLDNALDGLTNDMDNIESDILALDRGEFRPPGPGDKHDLYVEMLNRRMKQADFRIMSPEIQQMYIQKKQMHQDAMSEQIKQQKAMEDQMIPSGPPFVKTDLYESEKKADGTLGSKVVKSVFPMGALLWLRARLDAQGQTQAMLQGLEDKQASLDVLLKAGLLNQNYFGNDPGMQQQMLQQNGMNHGPALNMQQPPQQQG